MVTIQITHRVDARGLACPLPIVRTAQAVKSMAAGEVVEVLATDAGSVKDFAAWSRATGHPVVDAGVEAGVYRFVIQRK